MSLIYIIIEGDTQLRQGFEPLFKGSSKGVQVLMGGGVTDSVTKYRSYRTKYASSAMAKKNVCLLVDLDGPEISRKKRLSELGLGEDESDTVFFMVQCMEAWLLSQEKAWNSQQHPSEIRFPLRELSNARNGDYHKIRTASGLLKNLDIRRLTTTFPDFRDLCALLEARG